MCFFLVGPCRVSCLLLFTERAGKQQDVWLVITLEGVRQTPCSRPLKDESTALYRFTSISCGFLSPSRVSCGTKSPLQSPIERTLAVADGCAAADRPIKDGLVGKYVAKYSQSVSHYHTPSRELMAHTLTLLTRVRVRRVSLDRGEYRVEGDAFYSLQFRVRVRVG